MNMNIKEKKKEKGKKTEGEGNKLSWISKLGPLDKWYQDLTLIVNLHCQLDWIQHHYEAHL